MNTVLPTLSATKGSYAVHTYTKASIAIDDLITNPWLETPSRTAKQATHMQIDYWLSEEFADDGTRDEFVNHVRTYYPDYVFKTEELKSEDVVAEPAHYKTSRFEAIDVLEDFGLTRDGRLFNVGKYILRAGKKDDELQDLKKARQYLNRYINALEGNPGW